MPSHALPYPSLPCPALPYMYRSRGGRWAVYLGVLTFRRTKQLVFIVLHLLEVAVDRYFVDG